MSVNTADKLVYRVRHAIKDLSATEPRHNLPAVLVALDRAYLMVRADLPSKLVRNAAFISVVAGTQAYTLTETDPETLDYFRRASDGIAVQKVSLSIFETYRVGNPDAPGDPLLIAFQEAESGVVTARLWPKPTRSDTIEATVQDGPNITFEGLAGTTLSSTSLNIGAYGAEAVVYYAAGILEPDSDFMALGRKMVEAEIERIMVNQSNPEVVQYEA